MFIIGVGAMIGAMGFGMSRSLGRVLPPWDGLANLGLLVQFPVMHSLLLTRVGGKLLRRLSPASIAGTMATTTYALLASVRVLLLFVFWTPSGIVWWRADGAMLWMCLTLYAASWLLLLKSIWDAGLAVQTGFLGWWAVSHNRRLVYPPMPATGLFRLIRQSIYVAFALTLWTVPVWTPDQMMVAVVLTTYCVIGPLFKEARFRQRFGEEFARYVSRTPYWLPWPRPCR